MADSSKLAAPQHLADRPGGADAHADHRPCRTGRRRSRSCGSGASKCDWCDAACARTARFCCAARARSGASAQPRSAACAGDARYYCARGLSPRRENRCAHAHPRRRRSLHGAGDRAINFRILTINVDYPDFPGDRRSAARCRVAAAALSRARRLRRDVLGAGLRAPGLERSRACAQIDAAVAQGAVGMKIWKNIGMALQGCRWPLRDAG